MKRFLFAIIFILTLTFEGYSIHFDLGGRGGFGYGTHSSDGAEQYPMFHAGIGPAFEVTFFDLLAVDLSFSYQDKGSRYPKGHVDVSYLEIPIMAKLYFYQGFWIGAGTHMDFLLSSNLASNNDLASFDTGFLLGLGGKFALNKDNSIFITTDFLVDYGVLDVLVNRNGDQLNRSYKIQFGLMYRIF